MVQNYYTILYGAVLIILLRNGNSAYIEKYVRYQGRKFVKINIYYGLLIKTGIIIHLFFGVKGMQGIILLLKIVKYIL